MSLRLSPRQTVLLVVAVFIIVYIVASREPVGEPLPPSRPAPTNPARPSSAASGAPTNTWYQVFFTTPRYPDKPEYHQGSIDERLAALITRAQRTIDLAGYDFDLENVAEALAQAAARGVRVRMVTDTDTLTNDDERIQRAFSILKQAGIPIVDDQRGPIMHHKFVVVDGGAVWTGSWNFTENDTYRLNNNAILVASPELAQNYTAEFEKMFVERAFGPNKPAGVPYPLIETGGVRVESCFAPQDECAQKVAAHISRAQQSIRFLAFSFTNDTIGEAMLARAQAGVPVAGVFETTGSETKYSEYGRMRRASLDVLQDGNPYVMHHKVIVIDSRTVIFGSFNFSDNADTNNDENMLIVDDPALAQQFEAEYGRVRDVALNPPKRK